MKNQILILSLSLMIVNSMYSADLIWIGPLFGGSWSNALNWDQNRIPNYDSRVYINRVAFVNLGVETDSTGTGFFRPGFRQLAYMENHGDIMIQNTASHGLEVSGRSIYNNNLIHISQCEENGIPNTTAVI